MTRASAEAVAWSIASATLVGTAIHWFITPMSHPNASTWHTVRVLIKLGLGVAVGAYTVRRVRLEREIEEEDRHLDQTAHRTFKLREDGD